MTQDQNNKYFYITTPIYYVNDKPHLGHAYTTVACDVLARFKRLDGHDVKFLTGTDEHGLKIKQAAEKAGIDPQTFTDTVSQNFRDLIPLLNFSNDDFIRTTEDRHKRAVQALWNELVERDEIYLDTYSGWYAVRDEAYYTEDELITKEDGKQYAPTGADIEWMEEETYFFRLSKWQEPLLDYYAKHPDFIAPNARANEVLSFVKGGLRDLSVSRTNFNWGVKVPNNDKHVMYVWIDALTNYITALGYPGKSSDMENFWPEAIHVVGKDILRFHAVYWPAFLMAANIPLPKRVFAHGWWTIEGEKMSKSLGNVITPQDLISRYGVDASRYFMLREVPFGSDGDFSHDQAVNRINADLSNGLGNLVQRTLSFIYKNCDGIIVGATTQTVTSEDTEFLAKTSIKFLYESIAPLMDQQKFDRVLEVIMQAVYAANAYIDKEAPWTLRKNNELDRMNTVLYNLCMSMKSIAILLQPFMPVSASKILDQLNVPFNERSFNSIGNKIPIGTKIEKPEGIFPRIQPPEVA
jgi:methionyl-tRNA synthetase